MMILRTKPTIRIKGSADLSASTNVIPAESPISPRDQIEPWPKLDFNKMPLSQAPRQQLAKVYRDTIARSQAGQLSQLTRILHANAYDQVKGTYMPVGDRLEIPGKCPLQSAPFAAMPLAYLAGPLKEVFFSNPLVIPAGYGEPDFNPYACLKPRQRLASTGFLITTIEFDPESREQFEETLEWTRGPGGKFSKSLFAGVDRELCRLQEYRGFSVVYSGRRSLQLNFLFSTAHIKAVSPAAIAKEREGPGCEIASALLHNVHDRFYDHVSAVVVEKLQPSIAPDEKMRCATQWRRMGGGVRTIEKAMPVLGLEVGMRVPQLSICENIRERAPKGAKAFLVSPDITLTHPVPKRVKMPSPALPGGSLQSDVIALLRDCR